MTRMLLFLLLSHFIDSYIPAQRTIENATEIWMPLVLILLDDAKRLTVWISFFFIKNVLCY